MARTAAGMTMRKSWLVCTAAATALAGALVAGAAAPDRPAAKTAAVTYARDVAPILQQNCLSCHRSGEVAPFSMEDAKETAAWAQQIKLSTRARRMPPWKAEPGGPAVHDERRLTDAQIATIAAWADAGAPLGDLKKLPPAPTFPPASAWKLSAPDRVISSREPYALAAEGADVYRCFVVPTEYAEDRYLSALEVKPGNRAVVHHVIAWLDTSGEGRRLDEAAPGEGYTSTGGFPGFSPAGFLGGWAPGNEARHLPDGVGIKLPKGSDIVLEVHYHKNGKPETDQTKVGLYFREGPVNKRLRAVAIANGGMVIPAGAPDHLVTASTPFAKDITVLSVMPHMHLLGRKIDVSAQVPGKPEPQPLVSIDDWDFNWQMTYTFKEPLKLPAGARIDLAARYDNSDKNPRNPSRPPKEVRWGEQTTDEMSLAFVFYTIDGENLAPVAAATKGASR